MSIAKQSQAGAISVAGERDTFVAHVADLVNRVEIWAQQADWSTRRIEKSMRDSQGSYSAPGLLMQREFCRVLLDPIGASSSGDEGVVDLYRMPEYDDVARLYFSGGQWRLHFVFPGAAGSAEITDATSPQLSQELLNNVLDAMSRHAA